jgi:hypothetical protein
LQRGQTVSISNVFFRGWLQDDAGLTLFFNDTNRGSIPLFWQLIPASRSGDDVYGVTFGKDTATVSVFNKSAVPRALR